MTDVTHDADDLKCLITEGHHQSLADGILARKGLTGEQFTDDQNLCSVTYLLFGETPSPQKWNAQRAKVTLVYPSIIVVKGLVGCTRRATLNRVRHVIRLSA